MARWREDIDSLVFEPEGHAGSCVVHRRAFRALLGREAARHDCLAFFAAQERAFGQAAAAKIGRGALAREASFHLTSRDLRKALGAGAP
jgi:hypothetical protein